MGDEEVIKRKLIIDGDGMGDDRRLNVLFKTFIKWCNTENESPQESQMMQNRILSQLAQCEYAHAKSQLCAKTGEAELHNYERLAKLIETEIEAAKKEIEELKVRFAEAKTVRKNRVEYELLAKTINQQPDRKQTNEKLAALQREKQQLQETAEELEKKLDQRRKQFHVLLSAVSALSDLLEEPETDAVSDKGDEVMEVEEEDVQVVSVSTVEKQPLWTHEITD